MKTLSINTRNFYQNNEETIRTAVQTVGRRFTVGFILTTLTIVSMIAPYL